MVRVRNAQWSGRVFIAGGRPHKMSALGRHIHLLFSEFSECAFVVGRNQRRYCMPGPVSTEIGDRPQLYPPRPT